MLTVASFTRVLSCHVAVLASSFPARTHPGLGVGGPPGAYGRVAMCPSGINPVLTSGGPTVGPSGDVLLGFLRVMSRKMSVS